MQIPLIRFHYVIRPIAHNGDGRRTSPYLGCVKELDFIALFLRGRTPRQQFLKNPVYLGGRNATLPRIRGLVGSPATYRPELRPASIRTERTAGFQLAWIGERGKETATDPAPTVLRDGWNLVTREIGGDARSFLIQAGHAQPAVKKAAKGP